MFVEIFAIRDEIGGFFELPFTAPNTRSAERMLQDYSVLEPSSSVVLHAADYTLYRLGQYDRDTGVIVPCTYPEFVNRVSAYVGNRQGAAVGDSIPLKPQSDPEAVSPVEPVNASEEFDYVDNPSSKAQERD